MISIILLCCNLKKIRLAIALIKCSVDYSKDVKSSFIVPLCIYVVYILFLLYWIYAALFFFSSGDELK